MNKLGQQNSGGARLIAEGRATVNNSVLLTETQCVTCTREEKLGSSFSRPIFDWTRWQDIQSKSTCDESKSWSCNGLPNRAIKLKHSTSIVTAHFERMIVVLLWLKLATSNTLKWFNQCYDTIITKRIQHFLKAIDF